MDEGFGALRYERTVDVAMMLLGGFAMWHLQRGVAGRISEIWHIQDKMMSMRYRTILEGERASHRPTCFTHP